tara:strand:+ start:5219 stop:6388 length:1170 start_codon:yes stop_codon:yes gene_type:complete
LKIKIIYDILEKFPQNQYFLWKLKYFSEEEKFYLIRSILQNLNIDYEFIKKTEIVSYENIMYPIVNLSWISNDNNEIFSDELITLINKGVQVVFFNINEPYHYSDFKNFINYCKDKNIKEENIHFFVNNKRIENWLVEFNSKITFHFPYYQLIEHSNILQENEINFCKDKKRFKFLCHNNKIHIHRFSTLILLHHYKILEDTDYSCVKNVGLGFGKNLQNTLGKDYSQYSNSVDYILQNREKLSHYEKNFVKESIDSKIIKIKTFKETYCNIVTETHYLEDVVHITEKSLKPFYYFQFPIIIASFGHVKTLKELYNLDFFDDIIDHSYDNEKDNIKRFKLILNEIIKLQKIITPELYNKNKDRFIKNHKLICDIINIKKDTHYIKKLFT